MEAEVLVLSDEGREAHDDGGERGLDVRVRVGDELLHTRQNVLHHQLLALVGRQTPAELLELRRRCRAHFRLHVLQQVLEGGHQV